jgi:hypothetical protein
MIVMIQEKDSGAQTIVPEVEMVTSEQIWDLFGRHPCQQDFLMY